MRTVYGRKVGEKLAEQLCNAGLTIVSGLARGIDSVCHEAVLRAKGKTIAVFGTGIDNIYPPENTSLAERIAETGLLFVGISTRYESAPGIISGTELNHCRSDIGNIGC